MAEQPDSPGGQDSAPQAGTAAVRSGHAGRRQVSGWRAALTVMALAFGLCGLAAAAAGIVANVLPRQFTAAQARQIMGWETARRWRLDQAGKIFPASVPYQLPGAAINSGSQLGLTARRLGIARQAVCTRAADAAAARVLSRFGCSAVLRATYADSTSSLLVTVGIAQLRSSSAALTAATDISGPAASAGAVSLRPGLRAVSYPGTLAAAFGDGQRQLTGVASSGPYLILSAAGFADGRPQVQVLSDRYAAAEMTSFANGVADAVGAPLGALPAVPHCPAAPGC